MIDALNSELSGSDKATAGAQLARGRVGSMGQADVSAIIATPARYRLGALGAADGRDVLLRHQAAVDDDRHRHRARQQVLAAPPGGAQRSDCTVYVKDVLGEAFAAKGQAATLDYAPDEAVARADGAASRGPRSSRRYRPCRAGRHCSGHRTRGTPPTGGVAHPDVPEDGAGHGRRTTGSGC